MPGYQRAARERLRALWEALSAKRDNDSFPSTNDKSFSTSTEIRTSQNTTPGWAARPAHYEQPGTLDQQVAAIEAAKYAPVAAQLLPALASMPEPLPKPVDFDDSQDYALFTVRHPNGSLERVLTTSSAGPFTAAVPRGVKDGTAFLGCFKGLKCLAQYNLDGVLRKGPVASLRVGESRIFVYDVSIGFDADTVCPWDYPSWMKEYNGALSPIRSALRALLFKASIGEQAFIPLTPEQIGDVSGEPALSGYLRKENEESLHYFLQSLEGFVVVGGLNAAPQDGADGPELQHPSVNAVRSTKAWQLLTKWVGSRVKAGTLDAPSRELFCEFLQRHDRYAPSFGRTPPAALDLAWGESESHPGSYCLYVYDKIDPTRRMDIGASDAGFANALRSPTPSEINLRHRSHAAIRELTTPLRKASFHRSPPTCAECKRPLLAHVKRSLFNLYGTEDLSTLTVERLRQIVPELSASDASAYVAQVAAAIRDDLTPFPPDGEFDHVLTVAEIHDKFVAPHLSDSLFHPPPRHHEFVAGTARHDVATCLADPNNTRWLCGGPAGCHANVTADFNRQRQLMSASHVPNPSALTAWWAVHVLCQKYGEDLRGPSDTSLPFVDQATRAQAAAAASTPSAVARRIQSLPVIRHITAASISVAVAIYAASMFFWTGDPTPAPPSCLPCPSPLASPPASPQPPRGPSSPSPEPFFKASSTTEPEWRPFRSRQAGESIEECAQRHVQSWCAEHRPAESQPSEAQLRELTERFETNLRNSQLESSGPPSPPPGPPSPSASHPPTPPPERAPSAEPPSDWEGAVDLTDPAKAPSAAAPAAPAPAPAPAPAAPAPAPAPATAPAPAALPPTPEPPSSVGRFDPLTPAYAEYLRGADLHGLSDAERIGRLGSYVTALEGELLAQRRAATEATDALASEVKKANHGKDVASNLAVSLRDQLQGVQNELAVSRSRVADFNGRLTDMSDQFDVAADRMKSAESTAEQAATRLSEARKERDEMMSQRDAIRSKLEGLQTKYQGSQQAAREARERHDQYVQSTESDTARLQFRLEGAEKSLRIKTSEADQACKLAAQLVEEHEELFKERDSMASEMASNDREKQALTTDLDEARGVADALRDDLDAAEKRLSSRPSYGAATVASTRREAELAVELQGMKDNERQLLSRLTELDNMERQAREELSDAHEAAKLAALDRDQAQARMHEIDKAKVELEERCSTLLVETETLRRQLSHAESKNGVGSPGLQQSGGSTDWIMTRMRALEKHTGMDTAFPATNKPPEPSDPSPPKPRDPSPDVGFSGDPPPEFEAACSHDDFMHAWPEDERLLAALAKQLSAADPQKPELPAALMWIDERLIAKHRSTFTSDGFRGAASLILSGSDDIYKWLVRRCWATRTRATRGRSPRGAGSAGSTGRRSPSGSVAPGADPADDDDDRVTLASLRTQTQAAKAVEEWTAILRQTPAEQAEHFARSPNLETIKRVLDLPVDESGYEWYVRSFFNENVITSWLEAKHDTRVNHEASKLLEEFKPKTLSFDADLSDPDTEVKANAWDLQRQTLLLHIDRAITGGTNWKNVLKFWRLSAKAPMGGASAGRGKKRDRGGNVQITQELEELAKDEVLLANPPLHADVIMYKFDMLFGAHSVRFGVKSSESAWIDCVSRKKGEALEGCAKRHVRAFITKMRPSDPHINESRIWENKEYRLTVNEKFEASIGNDESFPERGHVNEAVFSEELFKRRNEYDRGDLDCSKLSCVRIVNDVVDFKEQFRESQARKRRDAGQPPAPLTSAGTAAAANAALAPPAAVNAALHPQIAHSLVRQLQSGELDSSSLNSVAKELGVPPQAIYDAQAGCAAQAAAAAANLSTAAARTLELAQRTGADPGTTVAAVEQDKGKGDGKGDGKGGGKGNGRGGGKGGWKGGRGEQSSSAGAHGREPPPSSSSLPKDKASWPGYGGSGGGGAANNLSKILPPQGSTGHPWAESGRTWQHNEDWSSVMVDFWGLRILAGIDDSHAAVAQVWPADSSCTKCAHFGPNESLRHPNLVADTCKFCYYRPKAPPGTPASELYKYGTGDGKHEPARCGRVKRYIAEGGNQEMVNCRHAKEPLSKCLRFSKNYIEMNNPSDK